MELSDGIMFVEENMTIMKRFKGISLKDLKLFGGFVMI